MFNIPLATVKTRLKIPTSDIASEAYLTSLDVLATAMCEGLLRSSLQERKFQDTFRLNKSRLYNNLPNGRFPLLLSSGFVSEVQIYMYHQSQFKNYLGELITTFDIDEIDTEAGVIYVPEQFNDKEIAVIYKTGVYDYPAWVQELYLQNLEYSRSLPNEANEETSGGRETHRQVIATLMQRNRRPIGNKLPPMFTKELPL